MTWKNSRSLIKYIICFYPYLDCIIQILINITIFYCKKMIFTSRDTMSYIIPCGAVDTENNCKPLIYFYEILV